MFCYPHPPFLSCFALSLVSGPKRSPLSPLHPIASLSLSVFCLTAWLTHVITGGFSLWTWGHFLFFRGHADVCACMCLYAHSWEWWWCTKIRREPNKISIWQLVFFAPFLLQFLSFWLDLSVLSHAWRSSVCASPSSQPLWQSHFVIRRESIAKTVRTLFWSNVRSKVTKCQMLWKIDSSDFCFKRASLCF